jgi:hypothetical protein
MYRTITFTGLFLLGIVSIQSCSSFVSIREVKRLRDNSQSLKATLPALSEQVIILDDSDAVGTRVREIVQAAAKAAISEKGRFWLAIPGGSILKIERQILVGDSGGKYSENASGFKRRLDCKNVYSLCQSQMCSNG